MLKIVKFRYSGLWNSEYPLVVNRLIDIVGAYNLQSLRLQTSFDRLAAFRPLLAKIEVQERADRESAQLSELDQQRDTLFNVIHGVAKTHRRAPIAAVSEHAARIMTVLKKHGTDIPTANYTAETKRLFDFIADISAQPGLMASISALALQPHFECLIELNTEFDRLFMQRNQRQSETERVDVRAIRIECDKAISLLWSAIEFCMNEYGKENYIAMVNAINNLNGYYKQQLAARATRRKAKADVSREEAIVIDN